ncbi:hypothetical protein LX36DRAFT_587334, partial [Colletotrichum falcatum]
ISVKLLINIIYTREAIIYFSSSNYFKSLRTIKVPTLISSLTFYVIALNTLFLLCLKDID